MEQTLLQGEQTQHCRSSALRSSKAVTESLSPNQNVIYGTKRMPRALGGSAGGGTPFRASDGPDPTLFGSI